MEAPRPDSWATAPPLRPREAPVERNGQKWARQRGAFPANRDLEPQEDDFVEKNPDLEAQEGDFPRKIVFLSLKKAIRRKKSRS